MRDERKTKRELIDELQLTRAQAERAEAIIAGMGDGVIIQDTSYRITYQNDVNKKLFGDRKGEFCYQVYEGIDHVCEWCPVESTYRDGNVHTVLRKIPTPEGTRYYELTASPLRDANGEITAGIKIVRDVTQREVAEAKLAYSEEYLSSIIRNEPECVKLMDPDGTVLDMNPAGLAMLEADSPDQVVGRSLFGFIDPVHCGDLGELSQRVCSGEKCSMEFQALGLKGTRRWLQTHCVPFEDRTTGRTLILAVTRDITERKHAEEELREAKRSLERQNRELKKLDRMKDALLHDVSHELKTPVAKHAMQLEILRPFLESLQLGDREAKAFQVMEESVRRQESVIRNLLDLARLESGKRIYDRQVVLLDAIVAGAAEDYRDALAFHDAQFELNVPPSPVIADGEILRHVFSNIINNAIKFRRKDRQLKVAITAEQHEGELLVRVSDNGIGLEEEEKRKLFTRFYQTSSSTEGSGVGLAMSRRIVEDHGGRIWIDSEGIGKGATVSIALPLAGKGLGGIRADRGR